MSDSTPDGREVARLRLPLPVRRMDHLVTYLEKAYGKDLVMHQEGEWIIVTEPVK